MADKPTGKPTPPPVPARSGVEPAQPGAPASAPPPAVAPDPAPPPAVAPDPATAPASVRDSFKGVQRRPPARPAAPARPTPPPSVRTVAPAAGVSTPRREVTVDDEVWILRQEGAGCVGYDRDSGATILSIGLEPPKDRDERSATRYVLARALDDVAEDELVSLVREVARAPNAESKAAGGTPRGHRQNTPSRRHARKRHGRRR